MYICKSSNKRGPAASMSAPSWNHWTIRGQQAVIPAGFAAPFATNNWKLPTGRGSDRQWGALFFVPLKSLREQGGKPCRF